MGFAPGVEVTLDNALKMLMVKSPNDVAVMIAESIDGSVEAFADEMNATALKLGMRESHFVNPNGLHDPAHVSSARDMAIVARALLRDFPEQRDLYGIGALQLGDEIIANHNGLLGRYPGADGMKTGFTCPAGFNVVATRDPRRAPADRRRARRAFAARAHDGGGASVRRRLRQMGRRRRAAGELCRTSAVRSAPDMRGEICSRRNRAAVLAAEEEDAGSPTERRRRAGAPYAPPSSPAPPPMTARGRDQAGPFRSASRSSSAPSRAGPGRCCAAQADSASRRRARRAPIRRAYANDKPPLAEGAERRARRRR